MFIISPGDHKTLTPHNFWSDMYSGRRAHPWIIEPAQNCFHMQQSGARHGMTSERVISVYESGHLSSLQRIDGVGGVDYRARVRVNGTTARQMAVCNQTSLCPHAWMMYRRKLAFCLLYSINNWLLSSNLSVYLFDLPTFSFGGICIFISCQLWNKQRIHVLNHAPS